MDRHDWDARYAGAPTVWGLEPNRFVAAECADLPPGRALDLACGEGRNAVWLAARGWRVTGVDFSPVAIDKARRLARDQGVDADFLVADLRGYEPAPRGHDLVLLAYLQVPDEDRRVILPRAAAAVAPGGVFLLVAHDRRNVTHGTGGPQDPRVCYDAGDVVALLGDLVVERAGEVTREVDGRTAIDVLVRARRATG
ncbi:MAG: hypothetical protein KatS3mg009_1947 [Acidimicrobiia bacterium]|nr:MAG: hypothetical protein KatS3mg009_1947 [Acidimicrobiia bacterium]